MNRRKAVRNPEPVPNEQSLYPVAVKALARRARSSGEIRALLARKKAAKQVIDAVLKRLKENGYLDDARFARAFASSRVEGDLHGKTRVRRDLLARRVHPEVAQEAVRAAFENVDEGKLLRQYLRRKVHVRSPLKPSAVASLYRRLLRAGFASDTIVRELKGILGASRRRGGMETGVEWDEVLDSLAEPEPESESESEPRLP
jgi:regulatory protein